MLNVDQPEGAGHLNKEVALLIVQLATAEVGNSVGTVHGIGRAADIDC